MPTKKPSDYYFNGHPNRKIVAWRYWSNNSQWGYAAVLECGHERIDLTSVKGQAHDALCWYCKGQP